MFVHRIAPLAVVAAWMAAVSPAPAQSPAARAGGPIIRDHRTRPDLNITNFVVLGDYAKVSVVNREGPGNNKPTTLRISMYTNRIGVPMLLAQVQAPVPLVPSGDVRHVYVRLPQSAAGLTLTCHVDYNNQLAEVNETNNTASVRVK